MSQIFTSKSNIHTADIRHRQSDTKEKRTNSSGNYLKVPRDILAGVGSKQQCTCTKNCKC